MSVAGDHDPQPSRSYTVARQRRLRRVLQSYGILTRERLRDAAGANAWRVPFELTLLRAVRAGRVRRLGRDFYKAGSER